mmetsp:Transcript_17532/g.26550  ORF Transcript_17532/g.26550 Transcript_17532/m.26550 type:complete len:185 (-) Transcript_17532:700-1254(-)
METLNKARPPDLITNIEVLKLLEERVSLRNAEELDAEKGESSNGKKKTKKKRTQQKLRQRDWIEEQVVTYLKNTPCAKADFQKLPPLVSKLRSTSKDGFGLTPAETLQILNFMPTEAVDIHLMIDDLQTRIVPEERHEELLETVRKCVKSSNEIPSNEDPQNSATEEGMEFSGEDDEEVLGEVL